MSVFSQNMKDVVLRSQRGAFTQIASMAPREVSLERWLQLELAERAPEGSVLLVEIQGDRLTALVVDTETEHPHWRIAAPRGQLAALYDGMLGRPPSSLGSTLLLFAPLRGSSAEQDRAVATTRTSPEPSATPTGRGDRGKPGIVAHMGSSAEQDRAVATMRISPEPSATPTGRGDPGKRG
jgi:hypothetical protein